GLVESRGGSGIGEALLDDPQGLQVAARARGLGKVRRKFVVAPDPESLLDEVVLDLDIRPPRRHRDGDAARAFLSEDEAEPRQGGGGEFDVDLVGPREKPQARETKRRVPGLPGRAAGVDPPGRESAAG